MKKLHFEHGATDGKYQDAYSEMLAESKLVEEQLKKDTITTQYKKLVEKRNQLDKAISQMEKQHSILLED